MDATAIYQKQLFDAGDLVLAEAAELIEKHGWIQDELHTVNGYCLIGALRAAKLRALPPDLTESGRRAIHNSVRHRLQITINAWGLVDWNDAYGRTKSQVIAALNEARTSREDLS